MEKQFDIENSEDEEDAVKATDTNDKEGAISNSDDEVRSRRSDDLLSAPHLEVMAILSLRQGKTKNIGETQLFQQ